MGQARRHGDYETTFEECIRVCEQNNKITIEKIEDAYESFIHSELKYCDPWVKHLWGRGYVSPEFVRKKASKKLGWQNDAGGP